MRGGADTAPSSVPEMGPGSWDLAWVTGPRLGTTSRVAGSPVLPRAPRRLGAGEMAVHSPGRREVSLH